MSKTLLFEIGTEEIPARFMEGAFNYMHDFIKKSFENERIDFSDIKVTGTPRRLVLLVHGVSEKQSDKVEEIIGPPVKVAFDANGNITKAGEGFARAQGVSVEDLKIKDTEKGQYVYVVKKEIGKPTIEILPDLLRDLVKNFPFPKTMRWGKRKLRFARPIHWFLALFGGEIVRFSIEDLKSSNITYGHRFLSPDPIEINDPSEYFEAMEKAYVIVDHERRKKLIEKQISEAASKVGGVVDKDDELLNEVTFLVEYPVATVGVFEPEFLELPKEVLITTMKEHQKYFPVFDENGEIMSVFVVVNNIVTEDMDSITKGNERVLRARLKDAKFFFDEDKNVPLESMLEKLKDVVFQEKLGTSYEKVLRFKEIATFIASRVAPDKLAYVERCALLCKADLESQMVYEFPELQGIMGREYAKIQGEPEEVYEGIFDHYLPRFSGDLMPKTITGAIVGIADRIDTIVGCFGIGLIPTGSEDPYGIRRDTLGIISVILNKQIDISLEDLINKALDLLSDKIERDPSEVKEDVKRFFRQRLYHMWVSEGYRYDLVDAVLDAGFDNILDAKKRLEALSELSKDPDFEALMTTFKRVVNIIPQDFSSVDVDESLFEKPEERNLYDAVVKDEDEIKDLVKKGNYKDALKKLVSFKDKVDKFFDNVMVMSKNESLKKNRLSLLNRISRLFSRVANLKKVVLEK